MRLLSFPPVTFWTFRQGVLIPKRWLCLRPRNTALSWCWPYTWLWLFQCKAGKIDVLFYFYKYNVYNVACLMRFLIVLIFAAVLPPESLRTSWWLKPVVCVTLHLCSALWSNWKTSHFGLVSQLHKFQDKPCFQLCHLYDWNFFPCFLKCSRII